MFVSLSQLQGKILVYIVVIELDGKLFSKAVQKNKRFLNFSGFVAKKVYPWGYYCDLQQTIVIRLFLEKSYCVR